MPEADDEGIPLEQTSIHQGETGVARAHSARSRRTSVHVARCQPRAPCERRQRPAAAARLVGDETTKFDRKRGSVRGLANLEPAFPEMFFVRVYPIPAIEHPAQEASRRGRPSSAPLVLEEAEKRLRGSDKALHISRCRKAFLVELSDWLRNTHPNARSMAAKTIGDHLRENAKVQALLPKAWLRQK